jgi:hypothetical protein
MLGPGPILKYEIKFLDYGRPTAELLPVIKREIVARLQDVSVEFQRLGEHVIVKSAVPFSPKADGEILGIQDCVETVLGALAREFRLLWNAEHAGTCKCDHCDVQEGV